MPKCEVIAIANQKGGVSKTTTTFNLGVTLAPKEETADISKLTVAELKEMAKANGIEGYTSMKKAELLEVLSK